MLVEVKDTCVVCLRVKQCTKVMWTVGRKSIETTKTIEVSACAKCAKLIAENEPELVVDDLGRAGVVDGPRCDFCVEHGVASCSHQGM